MYIAYLHVYNKAYDFAKGQVFMEWLCFLGCICLAIMGCRLEMGVMFKPVMHTNTPLMCLFKLAFGRPLFAAFLSYLLLMMLSP